MELPEQLEGWWRADEVAHCLPISTDLSNKIMNFYDEFENPTPLGGDGSNGTVETPDGQDDPDNDDKIEHWWGKLNDAEQREIFDAFKKEYPKW